MTRSEKADELRREAEKRLGVEDTESRMADPAETQRLIHELRVHQIELEMQNEELLRIQGDLERSRDRYLYLFDNAPVGYLIVDGNGTIVESNRTFADMVGIHRADLRRKSLGELIIDEDREVFSSRFKTFHRQPDRKRLELRIHGRNEETMDLAIEGAKPTGLFEFPDTGRDELLLLTLLDITRRRADELKLQAALEEKTTLLHEIHHRVKNNMQVVSSMLNLQKKTVDDDKTRAILEDSQLRVQTMATIHESLYKSDNLSLIQMDVHLGALVQAIERNYFNEYSRIRVSVNADPVQLGIEQATPLGMIVSELLSNAYKHAFPGDRTGKIHIDLIQTDETVLELTVRDDGVGVPEDLDLANTDSFGLHIVRILSQGQLQGTLAAENDGGAVFRVRFQTPSANQKETA